MYEAYKIIDLCTGHNIKISEAKAEKLSEYCRLLAEANQNINLTRNDSEEDMLVKNILDCVLLANNIPEGTKIADVGCGAGLPGVVIAIIRDAEVTMIDSVGKKVDFVNNVCERLCLNAKAYNTRAEIMSRSIEYREQFDIVTSRAVAPLNQLIEYCAPLVKKDGYMYALKGKKYSDEVEDAMHAMECLNMTLEEFIESKLNDGLCSYIVKLRKTTSNSEEYPRPTKKIIKYSL